MKLEDLKPDLIVQGIVPNQTVKIISVKTIGNDAVTIVYRDSNDKLDERMLLRQDETQLELVFKERPWNFDGDGADFRMAAEAYRIKLAHLFDPMMAVHISHVEPLPHQITAVYESMLPRQPLRFLLADDPGAGKTIMAGLFIRELMLRGDVKRCLVIAPGSLVEQWQDELEQKFDLHFDILTRDMVENSRTGNPFDDVRHQLMICRLDQVSRNENWQNKLLQTEWDLIVIDEAHKMSASFFRIKVNKTKRYKLGEKIYDITRHLLLMTATPHNGKETDFQLFLALLDPDRFEGKFRDGVHKVDVSDIMHRMVKEDLLTFENKRLFPERCAYTVNYSLSAQEMALYEAVTDYVREEMNRADELDNKKRKGTVGFALTILQRRLASSPEAIYQSLVRRHKQLERRLTKEKRRLVKNQQLDVNNELVYDEIDDYMEDALSSKVEILEDELVDQSTAARTIIELEAEIAILKRLEQQALQVRSSKQDRKWEELSSLLQDKPEMYDASGTRHKLIIFTEHRDTINYLLERIKDLLGSDNAIATIHGSVNREKRRDIQEQFTQDKDLIILLATDAAGEGVNLQRAHLMINYDLPWNPNRIEQRFGRIHRIGQQEVCHLWNLVAN
jgi:SNF2 family DNA or RNA helicase